MVSCRAQGSLIADNQSCHEFPAGNSLRTLYLSAARWLRPHVLWSGGVHHEYPANQLSCRSPVLSFLHPSNSSSVEKPGYRRFPGNPEPMMFKASRNLLRIQRKYRMLGAQCWKSDSTFKHQTSSIKHQASNIKHPTSNIKLYISPALFSHSVATSFTFLCSMST